MFIGKHTPEWYQWGANEKAIRAIEMQGVHSVDDLDRIQEAMRKRRVNVSMSAGQAVEAMAEASRKNIQPNIAP